MPDTFRIGDEVSKATGYQFPSIVRSVFTTGAGETRYVVEHTESPGLLHIFSGSQLRLVARQACGWCGGSGYIQGKDGNDVERCWQCVKRGE